MYSQLKRLTAGKQLPYAAKSNATGENAVIEEGGKGAEHFYRVTTTQHNGWHRINTYYADGSADETYEK